jgi:DNA topoisomerase-6 subunit A
MRATFPGRAMNVLGPVGVCGGVGDAVKIDLAENDIKRANEIAAYPWFAENKQWQKEIAGLLKNGFKMEVEAMITKDISYVTEEYVPQRLKDKDWLD